MGITTVEARFWQISDKSKNEFRTATSRSWPTFFFQKMKTLEDLIREHGLRFFGLTFLLTSTAGFQFWSILDKFQKNDFNFRSFWKNFKKIEKNFDAKNLMSQLQEVGQLFFLQKLKTFEDLLGVHSL